MVSKRKRKIGICLLLVLLCACGSGALAAEAGNDLTVEGGEAGTDYSYENHVLTVLTEAPLTISGETKKDIIKVKDGVDASLTLENVVIRVLKNSALDIQNSQVTLRFRGENVLKSGMRRPGIHVAEYGSVTLSGQEDDVLYAIGGARAPGIGSDNESAGGNVFIESGIVRATGGAHASGIGSGNGQRCGDISISGGYVTAKGGMLSADIGPSEEIAHSGSVTLEGGRLTADDIAGKLNFQYGVYTSGDLTEVKGRHRLSYPLNIAGDTRLFIGNGAELTVPKGVECSNEGTICVYGELTIEETFVNNGEIIDYSGELADNSYITGNAVITRDVWDIQTENGDITFTADGYEQGGFEIHTSAGDSVGYHLYGDSREADCSITVSEELEIKMILEDVLLAPADAVPALTLKQGASAELELKGENRFTCSGSCVQTEKNSSLAASGEGTLTLETK